MVLLNGPPGLGKTTLAHVIAAHCGYRVSEINASDDRAKDLLLGKVKDLTGNSTILADQRPTLLVIDEIDGAMGGDDGRSAVQVGSIWGLIGVAWGSPI